MNWIMRIMFGVMCGFWASWSLSFWVFRKVMYAFNLYLVDPNSNKFFFLVLFKISMFRLCLLQSRMQAFIRYLACSSYWNGVMKCAKSVYL